jgi:hypothetical protein
MRDCENFWSPSGVAKVAPVAVADRPGKKIKRSIRAQKSRPEGGDFVDLHLPRTYGIFDYPAARSK